jgi:hypothetical protein
MKNALRLQSDASDSVTDLNSFSPDRSDEEIPKLVPKLVSAIVRAGTNKPSACSDDLAILKENAADHDSP